MRLTIQGWHLWSRFVPGYLPDWDHDGFVERPFLAYPPP